MEKTPHVDGCLSVIAQAFMDSFSLSETQLGKVKSDTSLFTVTGSRGGFPLFVQKALVHLTMPGLIMTTVFQYAPTNKLLYAKDIPKFKQEVKMYYKQIRDQSPVTDAELKDFLHEESKVNHFSTDEEVRGLWESEQSQLFSFRNTKTSSMKPQPSERSTNSYSDTSQRSVLYLSGHFPPLSFLFVFVFMFVYTSRTTTH